MAHLLLSAAHKSSGKTTLCIGICAELQYRGIKVQPFKKGPDYIDPMWLSQAASCPCHNLDFYTQSHAELRENFAQHLTNSDIAIIEGNKGLYDGLALDGSNSNAALAKLLKAPVILVIDVQGITRGIAPLLLGYQAFDSEVQIEGVIFNKVGGTRHEQKLRQVVKHYTDFQVLGAVQCNKDLNIVERHLGLIPSNESTAPQQQIAIIRKQIAAQVDIELLQALASTAQTIATASKSVPILDTSLPIKRLRIGIAMDAAFGFYYLGDLQAMEAYGAELLPFSPIQDQALPDVDGLFIGGGFPETHMEVLEANIAIRNAIANFIEAGKPVYAECGGLMYLTNSITWKNKTCAMVGTIAANTIMYERPQGKGYVRLQETANCPWSTKDTVSQVLAGHEFHYSRLENLPSNLTFAFTVLRGDGIDGTHDGIVYKNLLAGFAHFRDVRGHHWTRRFLEHVRGCVPT